MSFSEFFKNEYYQKMIFPESGGPVRNRADSFLKIFQELEKKDDKNFFIVETGCMRPDWGELAFGDDGASTYIFDKFVNYYEGEVLSVDINQNNVLHAQKFVSSKTKIFCSDSVKFLWNISATKKIDFLYLDSYDLEPHNPFQSQLHHMKELCAISKNLKPGSIVVVDDNMNNPHFEYIWSSVDFKGGKSGFIKKFMENIDAELLFDEYQIGWKIK